MELLLLDTRTLAFVSCLGGFILGGTMLGVWVGGTRQKGVLAWALGGFLFGLGYLIGHLLLTLELPVPGWFATSLANSLIAAGHALILFGVQRHLGLPAYRWLPWLPMVLLAASLVTVYRQFPTPFITETVLLVGLNLWAAVLLWCNRTHGLTVYRRITAILLALYGLFLAGRMGYFLLTRAFATSFDVHLVQILTFLGSMLFAFALTMALVLMIFRARELRMREIARRDALTGLHNRYALADISYREYERARRYGTSLSLVAMDIDHFKAVNDNFGHAGGDAILKGVANSLRAELRDCDLVFRTGGEEFLALLTCTDGAGALEAAERMRVLIEASTWPLADQTVQVTASFGVAEVDPAREDWDQALLRADRALYRAKQTGRNRVEAVALPDGPAATVAS